MNEPGDLKALVPMAEESSARLSAADYGLVRRIGRRVGMDGEFFAWLSQVERWQASPYPICSEKVDSLGQAFGSIMGQAACQ